MTDSGRHGLAKPHSALVERMIADFQAQLTRADRELLVRYMVLRALGGAKSDALAKRTAPGQAKRRAARRQPRRCHAS